MNANERPTADNPMSESSSDYDPYGTIYQPKPQKTSYNMKTFSDAVHGIAASFGEDYWRASFEQMSDGSVKFGAYITNLTWIFAPMPDGVLNELFRLVLHKENMDVQLELPNLDSELPITNSELPSPNSDQIDLPF